ncbi:MAG: hypothetical protein ACM3N9_08750 [Syntrophothermus sp.]
MDCKISFIFIFLCIAAGSSAQEGARSSALAGATVSLPMESSVAGNPACMAMFNGLSAGINFSDHFLISELGEQQVTATLPFHKSRFGLLIRYSGFDDYSDMTAGAAYAMKLFPKLSAGFRIDYIRIDFGEEYGSKNLLSFRIGLHYQVNNQFSSSLLLANPYPVRLAGETYLEPSLRTGIAWNISKPLLALLEIEKGLHHPAIVKAAMEYHLAAPFYARIGILSSPARFSFGFGLQIKTFSIDISSFYHPVLGYSPQISLIYHAKK